MSSSIEKFRNDVDRLHKEIEELKENEPKHILLKIVLGGVATLLSSAAPLIAAEHKILSVVFGAVASTIKVSIKKHKE